MEPVDLKFVIEGEPIPKARPRCTKAGRPVSAPELKKAQGDVGWAFKAEHPGHELLTGPVSVGIVFSCHRAAGDLDNYVKLVLDGLNKVVWNDDRQVQAITAWIIRDDPEAYTLVRVRDFSPFHAA
jgi:crossover junction endodeoxyribonuclease RusA